MYNKSVFYILFSLICLFSCNQKSDTIPETATSGTLKLASDGAYFPILKQEIDIFTYLYKYAKIEEEYYPQEVCHELFIKDSVKMILSSRSLNEQELAHLKSKNVFPKVYQFARDGIVLVLNKSNKDSVISMDYLRRNISTEYGSKIFVTDNSKGGAIQSLTDLLKLNVDSLRNIYSADSIGGVTDYVKNHVNSIGVISSAWVSDMDNQQIKTRLNDLNIARVCLKEGQDSFLPFQSEIADSLYPLSRTIYIISRESKMGLANGFASFLLGEKGQRVILKSGLLPSRIPSREVVMSKKSIY